MLQAILNKSWQQHPTRHQLYGHPPPITKTIKARRTRHPGHCWRSQDELISDVLLWTPHMAKQKQDDQLEHTYSSNVRIRDVALKTCQRRWTIGRSGERGSGISVLAARHEYVYDDDDFCFEQCTFSLDTFWIKCLMSNFKLILIRLRHHVKLMEFLHLILEKTVYLSLLLTLLVFDIFLQICLFVRWIGHFFFSKTTGLSFIWHFSFHLVSRVFRDKLKSVSI